jgi:DNA-binding GntR family transcriptional regulator
LDTYTRTGMDLQPATEEVPAASSARAPDLSGFEKLRIEQSSTAQRVMATIRDLIMQGDLRPGQPLPEAAVATSLGVSRNTVREAFRLLTNEGLAVHTVNRSVTVKQLTAADIRDIYAARRALELRAIQSRPTVTQGQLDDLREPVKLAAQATESGDWNTVATQNLVFHKRIVELLGSDRIDAFFTRILAELALAFAMAPDEAVFLDAFRDDNPRILELIQHRDWDQCARAMDDYLERSQQAVEEIVDTAASGAAPAQSGP